METVLTQAEWSVMDCLWRHPDCTGRAATDFLQNTVGWTKSTTLTMLRRMTEKGLVACDGGGEVRVYRPLVTREDASMQETDDFLNRVYNGSVGLLVNAMTEKQKLSREEIDELYAILKKAEEARHG